MIPSEDRDLAIRNAKFLTERASMHLEHGRYSVAQDCLRSAAGWLELDESPSSSPHSSPAETKQAGAFPPRLRPAQIPAAPDTSVADLAAGHPITGSSEAA